MSRQLGSMVAKLVESRPAVREGGVEREAAKKAEGGSQFAVP